FQGPILPPTAGWPIAFNGPPVGPCMPQQTAVDTTNGNFYTCSMAMWVLVGAGTSANPTFSTLTVSNPGVFTTGSSINTYTNTLINCPLSDLAFYFNLVQFNQAMTAGDVSCIENPAGS